MEKIEKRYFQRKNKLDMRILNNGSVCKYITVGCEVLTNKETYYILHITPKYYICEVVDLDKHEQELETLFENSLDRDYIFDDFLETHEHLGINGYNYLKCSYDEMKKDFEGWKNFYKQVVNHLPKELENTRGGYIK